MAIDIQTIAMTSVYVPYERPPQNVTLWSAIPRGLQSFVVPTAQLDAKALNDSAILQLTATLPPNFGYVMQDAAFKITQSTAFQWGAEFTLNLQNFFRASEDLSLGLALDWVQDFRNTSLDNETALMQKVQPWPAFPIIGTPGTSGVLVVMSAFNPNAAAAAVGTVNSFISFWQFDLEQVRKFPINSPTPTHSR